jgi:hypothetical protein
MRCSAVALTVASLVAAAARAEPPAASVLLVGIDGLAPSQLARLLAEPAELPNLRRLRARGSRTDAARGVRCLTSAQLVANAS